MARVVSLELDHPVEERVIDVYTAEFLDALNPLRQIPTLVTETGAPIYDSRVICSYFDAVSGRGEPDSGRAALGGRDALGAGHRRHGSGLAAPDGDRPAGGEQSPGVDLPSWRSGSTGRSTQLEQRERRSFAMPGCAWTRIATAVALEYTDFRYTHRVAPALSRLERPGSRSFARRPA